MKTFSFNGKNKCQSTQRLEVFYKKAVVKNFAIFIGKHLCWSLFFVKLQVSQVFRPFSDNQIKVNPDKCHFLCSSDSEVSLTIENQKINSKFDKLLGLKSESKLNSSSDINDICQNAEQKLNATSSMTPNMDLAKRRLLVNAFFYSQFKYCQLLWIYHNRTNNNNTNRLHERCLRLIYNHKKSSFDDLLEKDWSVSIHHRNIRTLAVELFKVFKGLNSVFFTEVFRKKTKNSIQNE